MLLAGADYSVVPRPVLVQGERENREAEGYRALVHSKTGETLNIVRGRYEVVQPRESFDWFAPYLEAGCEWQTAGTLDGGRFVWAVAKLPGGPVKVTRQVGDEIARTVILINGFDGTSIIARAAAYRLICTNGMTSTDMIAFLKGRHTKSIHVRMEDAQRQIGAALGGFEKLAEQCRRLAGAKMTDSDLVAYLYRVFQLATPKALPVAPAESESSNDDFGRLMSGPAKLSGYTAKTQKQSRIIRQILECYSESPGQEGIRGTWYGGYNAVTSFLSHVRGRSPDSRARSNLMGENMQTSARALSVALDMAH